MAKEGMESVQEEEMLESIEPSKPISTPEDQASQIKEDQELAISVINRMPRDVVAKSDVNVWDAPDQIRPIVEAAFKGQPEGVSRAKRLLDNQKFVEQASLAFYEPFRPDAVQLVTALLETGDFPPTRDGYQRFLSAAMKASENAMLPSTIVGNEAARLFMNQEEKRVDDLLDQASDPESGQRMKKALHGPDTVLTVMEDVRTLANDAAASEPDLETAWKERMRKKLRDSLRELAMQAETRQTEFYRSPDYLEKEAARFRQEAHNIESTIETQTRIAKESAASEGLANENEKKLRGLLADVIKRQGELKRQMQQLDIAMSRRINHVDLTREEEDEIDRTSRSEDERWERDWDLREQKAKEANAADLAKKGSLKVALDALATEEMRLEAGLKAAAERKSASEREHSRELQKLEAAIAQNTRVLALTRKEADETERLARERREEYDAAMRVFATHPLEFKEQFTDVMKQLGGSEREASMEMDSLLARLESARKELVKQKMPVPAYLEWTKRASGTEWIKRKFSQKKAA